MQSVGQGRPVALPEPAPEDAGPDEAEAQNSVPSFLPPIFSTGGPRGAEPAERDGAALESNAAAGETSAPPVPVAATKPVPVGLAAEDLDRLKSVLSRLEECRQLLDQAVGAAG